MFRFTRLSLYLAVLFLFSCTQSLDFNQIEDYTARPAYTTALTYFSINSAAFASPPSTEITEQTNFEIFQNSFVRNNSVRLDFEFEIINEINRDFVLEINLLDANDNTIYQLQDLNIDANDRDFQQTEVIDITLNPNVKNFIKIEVRLRLENPLIPLTTSDAGNIFLKSAGTIYLETSL
ncbi:hypothetical protein FDT66_10260 [Polaribacter aestuariivivens]|uniref:Lipoprotein n=1 Tax=Polaribacter aestuariivivens TaxID=2304626 RepID=A0A5S3N2E0_9FLAO|nr:hypothetical protein [Polaribacter aestuariivivens]TMM29498.1 hypothetical protein FDT66_10260 [Polaribacter aestuariivivens]